MLRNNAHTWDSLPTSGDGPGRRTAHISCLQLRFPWQAPLEQCSLERCRWGVGVGVGWWQEAGPTGRQRDPSLSCTAEALLRCRPFPARICNNSTLALSTVKSALRWNYNSTFASHCVNTHYSVLCHPMRCHNQPHSPPLHLGKLRLREARLCSLYLVFVSA